MSVQRARLQPSSEDEVIEVESLVFRLIRPADLASICTLTETAEELYYCAPREAFPLQPASLQRLIEARSDSTVVEWNGLPVAFANFYRWQEGYCALGNLMVRPASRGQGVAAQLVEYMCRLAWVRHEVAEVRVSCFNHNTAGLLLYSGLGFEPFGMEKRTGPAGEPLVLLHLRKTVRG